MESYDTTNARLIQRYMLDKFGYDGTTEEFTPPQYPRHKHVWDWWIAMAYYQVDRHYFDLRDVPDLTEGLDVVIISDKSRDCYVFRKGKWRNEGLRSIKKTDMKAIYG